MISTRKCGIVGGHRRKFKHTHKNPKMSKRTKRSKRSKRTKHTKRNRDTKYIKFRKPTKRSHRGGDWNKDCLDHYYSNVKNAEECKTWTKGEKDTFPLKIVDNCNKIVYPDFKGRDQNWKFCRNPFRISLFSDGKCRPYAYLKNRGYGVCDEPRKVAQRVVEENTMREQAGANAAAQARVTDRAAAVRAGEKVREEVREEAHAARLLRQKRLALERTQRGPVRATARQLADTHLVQTEALRSEKTAAAHKAQTDQLAAVRAGFKDSFTQDSLAI